MSPKDPVTPLPCHLEPPASLLASETGVPAARVVGLFVEVGGCQHSADGKAPCAEPHRPGFESRLSAGQVWAWDVPFTALSPSFSSQWGVLTGRWAVLFRCGGPFRLGAGEPPLFPWESCSFGTIPVILNPHSCDTYFFWFTGHW